MTWLRRCCFLWAEYHVHRAVTASVTHSYGLRFARKSGRDGLAEMMFTFSNDASASQNGPGQPGILGIQSPSLLALCRSSMACMAASLAKRINMSLPTLVSVSQHECFDPSCTRLLLFTPPTCRLCRRPHTSSVCANAAQHHYFLRCLACTAVVLQPLGGSSYP